MITTLIIDDEKHCIDCISDLLQQSELQFNYLLSAQSVEEAIYITHRYQPDLVFLDVHLGNQTGFDFLLQLESIKFDIIFTTAYDQYAIEAFKFSALDYLLKPITSSAFQVAIKRFRDSSTKKYFERKMNVLWHNFKNDVTTRKITIPTQEGYLFLELSEVIYLKADGNYTHIYCKDGLKYTVAKTLKIFDEMLSDANFFRVHHSSIVNLKYVRKFHKGSGGYVVMEDGTSVNVSIRRKENFLKAFVK